MKGRRRLIQVGGKMKKARAREPYSRNVRIQAKQTKAKGETR